MAVGVSQVTKLGHEGQLHSAFPLHTGTLSIFWTDRNFFLHIYLNSPCESLWREARGNAVGARKRLRCLTDFVPSPFEVGISELAEFSQNVSRRSGLESNLPNLIEMSLAFSSYHMDLFSFERSVPYMPNTIRYITQPHCLSYFHYDIFNLPFSNVKKDQGFKTIDHMCTYPHWKKHTAILNLIFTTICPNSWISCLHTVIYLMFTTSVWNDIQWRYFLHLSQLWT